MRERLRKPLLMVLILGVIEAGLFYLLRFLVRPRRDMFAYETPHETLPGADPVSGEELMGGAQNLILLTLRNGPAEGMTNAEVGAATGLNPRLTEGRNGDVTRSILQFLAEHGLVQKTGLRYALRVPGQAHDDANNGARRESGQ